MKIYETVSERPFTVNYVPVETLAAQRAGATDSLAEAFAALMQSYAAGDTIDMRATLKNFPIALTSVQEFAVKEVVNKQLVHA